MADASLNPTAEIWKPVDGFPGYFVSDHGRLRNKSLLILGGISRQKGAPSHVKVRLRKDGKQHPRVLSRLVLTAFVGPCPEGMECCHWDGDPTNNHLSNLRWDTRVANRADMRRHGRERIFRGEEHPNAKFSDADARALSRLRLRRGDQTRLAKIFGVSQPTIEAIVNGRRWRHVRP